MGALLTQLRLGFIQLHIQFFTNLYLNLRSGNAKQASCFFSQKWNNKLGSQACLYLNRLKQYVDCRLSLFSLFSYREILNFYVFFHIVSDHLELTCFYIFTSYIKTIFLFLALTWQHHLKFWAFVHHFQVYCINQVRVLLNKVFFVFCSIKQYTLQSPLWKP